MNELEKYKQNQIETAKKLIFEQDKEVLRAAPQQLLKANNKIVLCELQVRLEYQKLLDLCEKQQTRIKQLTNS